MQETVLISLPIKDLQAIIVECVNSCLKYHIPEEHSENKNPTPEENFTIKQLADYWQVHPQTIMKQKKAGLLPFYQNRRTVMFKKSEIDKMSSVPTSRPRR